MHIEALARSLRRFAPLVALLAACGPAASGALPAPAVQEPATAVEPIPVAAFGATPFLDRPRLSPDGTRIAARLDVKGKAVLGIVYATDAGRAPTTVSLDSKQELRWVRWVGNDRLLLSVGIEANWSGYQVYVTRLLVYDIPVNTLRFIGKSAQSFDGDNVLYVSDDGGQLLLSLEIDVFSFPEVHRVDLDTGEMTRIVRWQAPIVDWRADATGVVRLGIGHSKGRTKIVYRDSEQEKFRTLARVSFERDDGEIDSVRFPTSGGKGFVLSNGPTGRFALYEFDWKAFEFGKVVFEHPELDVDDFSMSEDGETVVAVHYSDDRRRVVWLEPEMRQLQVQLDRALPERENRIVDTSRNRRRLLVWSGAADDPGTYYLFDRDQRQLIVLASPLESLLDRKLSPVRAITYRSRDGLTIPGYLTLPRGREPKSLPLIVMPHGGPHIRDDWEFNPWVQFLANRGYAVLQPNFRGSAGYGREYLARGFGQWGGAMQDDLTDGAEWLVSQGIADPGRVCFMGSSYGGYAAIMATIKTPRLVRCAISFAGVTDVDDMMSYDRGGMLPARYRNWRRRVQGEQPLDLKSVSPVNRAAEVSAPLLLAHGKLDSNVPFRQAENLARALRKAGRRFEFLEFEAAGHGLDLEADRVRFLAAVEAFLAKHNPAGPAPGAPPAPVAPQP